MSEICGIICNCGPNQEPLACGYLPGHEGNHSWATLPTFTADGLPNEGDTVAAFVRFLRSDSDYDIVFCPGLDDWNQPTYRYEEKPMTPEQWAGDFLARDKEHQP